MSIREVETVEATATTPLLLQPAAFRGVTLRNRRWRCTVRMTASPMIFTWFISDALRLAAPVLFSSKRLRSPSKGGSRRAVTACGSMRRSRSSSASPISCTASTPRRACNSPTQAGRARRAGPGMAERGSTTRTSSCAANIRGRSFPPAMNPSTESYPALRRSPRAISRTSSKAIGRPRGAPSPQVST